MVQGTPEEYILSAKGVEKVNKIKDEFNSKVLVKRANVRTGPGKRYDVIAVITYGTPVAKLDEESGIWIKIRLEDGKEGWVAKRLLSM